MKKPVLGVTFCHGDGHQVKLVSEYVNEVVVGRGDDRGDILRGGRLKTN